MHSFLPKSTWTRSRDHQCRHRRNRRPPLPTSPSPVRRYLVTRVFDPLVILPRLLLKHSILAIASRLVQQEIDPQIHGADLQHCSSDAIRCVHYVSPYFEVPSGIQKLTLDISSCSHFSMVSRFCESNLHCLNTTPTSAGSSEGQR